MTYSNDDLYGIDFETYCERLDTTPERHIARLWTEIDMLQENYDRLLERRGRMDIALLCKAISDRIHAKRKAIERLGKGWTK